MITMYRGYLIEVNKVGDEYVALIINGPKLWTVRANKKILTVARAKKAVDKLVAK